MPYSKEQNKAAKQMDVKLPKKKKKQKDSTMDIVLREESEDEE